MHSTTDAFTYKNTHRAHKWYSNASTDLHTHTSILSTYTVYTKLEEDYGSFPDKRNSSTEKNKCEFKYCDMISESWNSVTRGYLLLGNSLVNMFQWQQIFM
jgi:hypothetical protein